MKQYALTPHTFLVQGALRGALLDTNTGRVYSLNPSGVSVLTRETTDESFWQELCTLDLAEETSGARELPELPRVGRPTLNFMWLEIEGEDCNESCLHCYADSMPPGFRRARGLPVAHRRPFRKKMSADDWQRVIAEGFELGCRACQFIGGEPFLYRDGDTTVIELAEYAKRTGYTWIEIFTNGTLITQKKVERIKELGLNIAISLYSHNPEIHDAITQIPGSHAKTTAALRMLKEAGVPTRSAMVVMKQNEDTVTSTLDLMESLGCRDKGVDVLRPKGRGQDAELMPSPETVVTYGIMTEPNFEASPAIVGHYTTGHSCLAGKITVTETGDALPCIFSRNQIMGNVLGAGGLEGVTQGTALQRVWNTTKDDVSVCRDCEYRYVCFDCRPLSEAAAEGHAGYLDAPYPRCSHNPYTGEWGKGLWRQTESGPVFDTEYGAHIDRVLDRGQGVHQRSAYEGGVGGPTPELTLVTRAATPSDQSSCQPDCSPMCYPANCSPMCTPSCSPYCLPQCSPR